jgi:threonine dehydrogenase-like Zn-dependent dehydrogenase
MMRAICWHGNKDVRVDTVPDPPILNRRDAILRVTTTAICGSDLHLYNGNMPIIEEGDILGMSSWAKWLKSGAVTAP